MKKTGCFILVLALILFTSCTDFEPAEVDIKVTPDSLLTFAACKADITDMGGCKHISDKGFCVGFKPSPTYNNKNNKTYSIEGQEKGFSHILPLDFPDTTYYICAFVKTDAGIGYSKVVPVKTYISN